MLSRKAYEIAEEYRSEVGNRHFGHFDRDAKQLGAGRSEAEEYSQEIDVIDFEETKEKQVLICDFEIDEITKEYTPVITVNEEKHG